MSDLSLTSAGRIDSDVRNDDTRLEQAGRLFEALFIQQMFGREQPYADDPRSRLFDEGPGERTARELLHQALGEKTAGSLGIADMLVERLATLRSGKGS